MARRTPTPHPPAPHTPAEARGPALNPERLSVADVAALLSRAGQKEFTEQDIVAILARGAPTNEDGSVHLVRFAAWLAKAREAGRRGG